MISVSLCVSAVATVCVGSEVTTSRTQEGGNTSIECPYGQGWVTYIKYFYKGNRVVVIQSQQQQHPSWINNGRYSLYDDRERRVFTVIITNTTLEDTDTYSCYIGTWISYSQSKIHLIVDRALSPIKPYPVTTYPVVLKNITMETDTTPAGGTSICQKTPEAPKNAEMFLGYPGIIMVCVSLAVLLLGLILLMIYKLKRDRKASRPTTNPDSSIQDSNYQMLTKATPDSPYQTLITPPQDS
ncbi:hypothetical protein UPYG_G00059020 [Umbra pygmaea]|uniref:Ig-like domain-containing protein n=1 Tax=Umbra pygmaea TaxID=75934 RepID=A0ABD0X8W9_UMBPY